MNPNLKMKAVALVTLVTAIPQAALADTITYGFDTDLLGTLAGTGSSSSAISFTLGTNTDSFPNAVRSHYSEDSPSDNLFAINARASDNAGTADANLDIGAGDGTGAASFLSFMVNPDAGNELDFTTATFSFDSSLYRDNTGTFDMGYRVFANTGSGFVAIGPSQVHAGAFGTGNEDRMFEVDGTTAKAGWNLTAGSYAQSASIFTFDLASLGTLAADQSVTFALSLSGTRDNNANFGSSIDNVVLGNFAASATAVPEPSGLAMLGLAGVGVVLRRRRSERS